MARRRDKSTEEISDNTSISDTNTSVPVITDNDFLLRYGENLPNHVTSLMGRGKFIRPQVTVCFRTRQEAWRFAAWTALMAEMLPDEDGQPTTFDKVLDAVRQQS